MKVKSFVSFFYFGVIPLVNAQTIPLNETDSIVVPDEYTVTDNIDHETQKLEPGKTYLVIGSNETNPQCAFAVAYTTIQKNMLLDMRNFFVKECTPYCSKNFLGQIPYDATKIRLTRKPVFIYKNNEQALKFESEVATTTSPTGNQYQINYFINGKHHNYIIQLFEFENKFGQPLQCIRHLDNVLQLIEN